MTIEKKRMPPGRARRLGRKAARSLPKILMGDSQWHAQRFEIGALIEVYDDLSWEPYKTDEKDYAQFLRGWEDGLSALTGCTVHLVYAHDRGNGHTDYRIVKGPRPRPMRVWRWQRRLNAVRKRQKGRAAMKHYDWFDREGKAAADQLVHEGLAPRVTWKLEADCRGEVLARGAQKWKPYYKPGASRADVLAAMREKLKQTVEQT